jgi:hypothetical protein
MRAIDYLTGTLLILLTWTAEPIVNKAVDGVAKTEFVGDVTLDWLRAILSTLTTIIVLLTAIIKFRKEKKK